MGKMRDGFLKKRCVNPVRFQKIFYDISFPTPSRLGKQSILDIIHSCILPWLLIQLCHQDVTSCMGGASSHHPNAFIQLSHAARHVLQDRDCHFRAVAQNGFE
jgi:hypothetical protein